MFGGQEVRHARRPDRAGTDGPAVGPGPPPPPAPGLSPQGREAVRRRPGLLRGGRVRPPQRHPLAGPAAGLPVRGDLLAAAPGLDRGRGLAPGVEAGAGRAGRRRRARHLRVGPRRHVRRGEKGGAGVGPCRQGCGTTLELVADRTGVPLGAATDGADVHEVNLAGPALADIPVAVDVPWGVPVLTDRAYDSDPLREGLAPDGFRLLARHRKNRTKPPVNDGRRLRRLKRRWVVERSFAWL